MPDFAGAKEGNSISIDKFNEHHKTLSDTRSAACFFSGLAQKLCRLQLRHYGLVNLPGEMKYEFTKP